MIEMFDNFVLDISLYCLPGELNLSYGGHPLEAVLYGRGYV